jgi:hypothetical protein
MISRPHTMDIQCLWVHFAIRDIAFPSPDVVLNALHAEEVVTGRVVDVSDSGATPNAFVVVELAGLEQPVVVPVAHVRQWWRR